MFFFVTFLFIKYFVERYDWNNLIMAIKWNAKFIGRNFDFSRFSHVLPSFTLSLRIGCFETSSDCFFRYFFIH